MKAVNIGNGMVAIHAHDVSSVAYVDCLLISTYVCTVQWVIDYPLQRETAVAILEASRGDRETLLILRTFARKARGEFRVELLQVNSHYRLYSQPLDFLAVHSLAKVKRSRQCINVIWQLYWHW